MGPDLPKRERRRARLRAVIGVWLAGVACLCSNYAPAQDTAAGDGPTVRDAVIEVDAEVNTWLARASAALRAGSPDTALPLLLRALKAAPDTMASTNGVTFLPARKLALALIRTLPQRTLAAYRLQVSASVKLPADAAARTDVSALEALYRDGLSGAAGAETGLRLAGLYLDQERFRDARRVLRDVLEGDVASRAQRSELLARLVVACARVGDLSEAARAWNEIMKQGGADRWAALGSELRPAAGPASNAWTMAYGGPAREAVAAADAPDLAKNGGWILRWGLNLGQGMIRAATDAGGAPTNLPTNLPPQLSLSRAYAAACMRDRNRRPAEELIFAGNKAWVNGFGGLATVDLAAGRVLQSVAHAADPAPEQAVLANGQVIIRNGRAIALNGQVMIQFGGPSQTSSESAESWVFANRLNRAVSLVDGQVLCIEDNPRATLDRNMAAQQIMVNKAMVSVPQPCGNALAAYAADTGRLLWRIGREATPQDPGAKPVVEPGRWRANAIRFAAAPVPCAGLLLAPLEDDSGLGVVGLDAHNGTPVWRTRLTYGPVPAAPRAKPLTMTVEGAYAYVCDGNGGVSALDGCDGSVLWTSLSELPEDAPSTNRVNPDVKRDAWEESLVLVAGDVVVALPEDSPDLLAFDRRSGTRLWTRRKPAGVDYVVGKRGAALLVAGARAVACVDLAEGREQWRTPLAGSTGRGTLCGPDVLIPHGQTILRLRAGDGAALGAMRAQSMDNMPLGNLYVHGDQILVAGPERLYALVDARQELARMDERLARQPTAEAHTERGRVYMELGRYVDAVADLREARRLRGEAPAEEAARGPLMLALWLAGEQDAGSAQALHEEACALAVTAPERAESSWRLAQYRERTGDTNGAVALYGALLAASDAMISPTLGSADLEVSARRLAAHRILVLGGRGAGWQAVAEEQAAQALARLGPAPAPAALIDLAMVFGGTAAGRDAALNAAQRLAERGDLGTAESLLQRALTLARPADRAAVAGELVRTYERMKWPRGVLRLRDDWLRLFSGASVPEALARAAAKAEADRRTAAGAAAPPWRLRWRQNLPPNTTPMITPAGLLYDVAGSPTRARCLALDTGLPRWEREASTYQALQRGGQANGDEAHLVATVSGGSGAFMDLWSGVMVTNALLRFDPADAVATVSEIGLAAVASRAGGGVLTSVDLLTGQVVWRRREMESLQGAGVQPVPLAYASVGVFLMRCEPDGNGAFVVLDPWTGDVAFRRPMTANGPSFGTMASQGGMWSLAFPRTPEREVPVLADGRLSVRDRRSGAVLWSSPPGVTIAKNQTLESGAVLAQTADDELLLLDGADGRVLSRSQGVRFPFDYGVQREIGDPVIAMHRMGDATNEVLVLDPAVGRIAYQGLLPQQAQPLLAFGPVAPDQLLVSANGYRTGRNGQVAQTASIQVINRLGENSNGWGLPRSGDISGAPAGNYNTIFAEGLILVFNPASGELLAYEHDPGKDVGMP